jgi:flagellar biosynthetic protein FliR
MLSFDKIPVGGAVFSNGLVSKVNAMGGAVFDIGLRVAAPVMVALLITDVALGFMARVAPQMNVFIVGFPLKIGFGLVVIMLAISYFPYIFATLFEHSQSDLVEIIRLLSK